MVNLICILLQEDHINLQLDSLVWFHTVEGMLALKHIN